VPVEELHQSYSEALMHFVNLLPAWVVDLLHCKECTGIRWRSANKSQMRVCTEGKTCFSRLAQGHNELRRPSSMQSRSFAITPCKSTGHFCATGTGQSILLSTGWRTCDGLPYKGDDVILVGQGQAPAAPE
jgi:hypothetical protein